jgi:hypothetical protein
MPTPSLDSQSPDDRDASRPEIAERLAKQLGIVWRALKAGKGKAGSKSRPLGRHMSLRQRRVRSRSKVYDRFPPKLRRSLAAIRNFRLTSTRAGSSAQIAVIARLGQRVKSTLWPRSPRLVPGPILVDLRRATGGKAADRPSEIAGGPSRRNHRSELLSHPVDHHPQARRQLPGV